MPPKPKYKVTQQVLSDYAATIEAKPNLTKDEIFKKFPEFGNDDSFLQSASDYVATSKSGKYKDVLELNSKFPEFDFGEKKNGSPTYTNGAPPVSTPPSPTQLPLAAEIPVTLDEVKRLENTAVFDPSKVVMGGSM